MVRFIMGNISNIFSNANAIYIPIWLDLLFVCYYNLILGDNDLHSNMVRFIIVLVRFLRSLSYIFTFQYG